jgi:hypothetical protein
VSRYPASALIDDFILLFLPPQGPHLTPLSTGSLEPSLLVSPLLGGPTRHRPFAPILHLHQRKPILNLHLQYSAKSQSTPRCQSLIQPGATIHWSSDAPVLNHLPPTRYKCHIFVPGCGSNRYKCEACRFVPALVVARYTYATANFPSSFHCPSPLATLLLLPLSNSSSPSPMAP